MTDDERTLTLIKAAHAAPIRRLIATYKRRKAQAERVYRTHAETRE